MYLYSRSLVPICSCYFTPTLYREGLVSLTKTDDLDHILGCSVTCVHGNGAMCGKRPGESRYMGNQELQFGCRKPEADIVNLDVACGWYTVHVERVFCTVRVTYILEYEQQSWGYGTDVLARKRNDDDNNDNDDDNNNNNNRQKCDQERSRENFKLWRSHNRNPAHVQCESKRDTSSNRGHWNHFKITKTIPEQQTSKARNEGLQKSSYIGHCTHTAGSANVKVQNIFHGRNNITCSINCTYRTAATLCTLEMWFVSCI